MHTHLNSSKKSTNLEREQFQHLDFHFIFVLQQSNFKPVDYIYTGKTLKSKGVSESELAVVATTIIQSITF